ncbi:MAG: LysR family transcriptional regulator [Hyphomicrobiaceae bacterium]
MSFSLKQIRYFIAAADVGQISQAAMELNVSQSAVTAAIKGLEELLEVRLFERLPNGVSLTYEGHQFLAHARHIAAAVDEAVQFPRRANESLEGIVRLAVSYTVAGYFLPPYLARFARAFPNIEVQLTESDRQNLEEGLISGEFDMSVMLISNLVNQEDIGYETLIRSRRRLWLCTDHPLLLQPSVSLKDVAEEPYIMLTVDEASNTAQKYWNRTPYRPTVIFRTYSVESVRSMVANGMGVTVLSDMVYRPWSLEGRRVEVKSVADTVPTMDVGLAWKRNAERSAASNAFHDFMHLAVGSDQP